jgi:mRNA interferase RelE/StbE
MNYRIIIEDSVFKILKKIHSPARNLILETIKQLGEDPRPHGCKKLKGTEAYRVRNGDYRIIYTINDKEILITVIKVGHRKDVYRQL